MARVTNFAARPRASARGAIFVIWTFALAAMAACGALTWQGLTVLEHEQTVSGHIDALRSEIAALEAADATAPTAAAYAALSDRIAYHNSLIGPRRTELPDLLTAIEAAAPEDVWLRELSYDAPTGRLSLSLLSREETALPAALQAIEAIDLLDDVILKRQTQLRQGQEELVQYEIGGVAR